MHIVEALPEGVAKPVLTHLCLEVRGKCFGWYMDNHHGDGRLQLNCKAQPGKSHALAARFPGVFHIPAYVGNKGWIGVWLDVPGVDWKLLKVLLTEAYCFVAPARLLQLLEAGESPPAAADFGKLSLRRR